MRLPSSKSLAQRALLCAALADGRTRLGRLPAGADVTALRAALGQLGVGGSESGPAACTLTGVPPGPHRGLDGERRTSVGESGTAARLLTAAVALCARTGSPVEIAASGTLKERSSPGLFRALEAAGVRCEHVGREGGWPVRVSPVGPPSTLSISGVTSSQEVSALLIAAAAWPDEIVVRVEGGLPSRPYVEMTRAVLQRFGVPVPASPIPLGAEGVEVFHVGGPLTAPSEPLLIEPDASAAAVALAAGCLTGGEVRVEGLTASSSQGDVVVVEHLAAFGCEAGVQGDALVARGAPRRAAEVDCGACPDLAPPLAVVAAVASLSAFEPSRLTGLETLPGKESSRIEVLARGLETVGFRTEASDRALTIGPPRQLARGPFVLDPAGDHRMAFAFGLLGLSVEGVEVRDPGCVAKSWPTFWSDLERAGARRLAP